MGGTLLVWPEGVGAVKIGCKFFISWSLVSLKVGLQFHYSEVLSVHELKPCSLVSVSSLALYLHTDDLSGLDQNGQVLIWNH